MFTWFDSILAFDSAGSSAAKCEQDVNRKKIVVTQVTFGYVRSQSADSLEHRQSGMGRSASLRRLFVRSLSYYTRVKFSMQNQMRLPCDFRLDFSTALGYSVASRRCDVNDVSGRKDLHATVVHTALSA